MCDMGLKKMSGKLWDEYQMYYEAFADILGFHMHTGEPMPTFDEWLNS